MAHRLEEAGASRVRSVDVANDLFAKPTHERALPGLPMRDPSLQVNDPAIAIAIAGPGRIVLAWTEGYSGASPWGAPCVSQKPGSARYQHGLPFVMPFVSSGCVLRRENVVAA